MIYQKEKIKTIKYSLFTKANEKNFSTYIKLIYQLHHYIGTILCVIGDSDLMPIGGTHILNPKIMCLKIEIMEIFIKTQNLFLIFHKTSNSTVFKRWYNHQK